MRSRTSTRDLKSTSGTRLKLGKIRRTTENARQLKLKGKDFTESKSRSELKNERRLKLPDKQGRKLTKLQKL